VHPLFADDAELMAESELELQHILNVFAEVRALMVKRLP
jgi:hypothetical protein